MKSVDIKKIQELDKIAIQQYGMPTEILMENAGRQVAAEALKLIGGKDNPKIYIVCGTGNNAGDGFVAARHLITQGATVYIFLIGQGNRLKGAAAMNYRVLKNLNYPIKESEKIDSVALNRIAEADLVIDAIFGVGISRDIYDPYRSVIQAVNDKAKKILSVDVPSGLNAQTGDIFGVCVKADVTVTFSFAKKGFFMKYGPAHTRDIVVAEIGIPPRIKSKIFQKKEGKKPPQKKSSPKRRKRSRKAPRNKRRHHGRHKQKHRQSRKKNP